MNKYLFEGIGAFFLVFVIGLTVNAGLIFAPIVIGGVLALMIYAGGHVSGAHYNPAVTLGVWLRGAIKGKEVLPYWAAQLVGAIVASFAVYFFTGKVLHVAPGNGVTDVVAFLGELIFTFALVFVVLETATNKATAGNSFYGLAIGGTVMVGAWSMGAISGGAFNPAVGIAPAFVEIVTGHPFAGAVWIYLVAPLLGGALAAGVFRYAHKEEFGHLFDSLQHKANSTHGENPVAAPVTPAKTPVPAPVVANPATPAPATAAKKTAPAAKPKK